MPGHDEFWGIFGVKSLLGLIRPYPLKPGLEQQ
jgi:hypothetical protein